MLKKGQESAPFELLIGVIIMIAVVTLGTLIINSMNEFSCNSQIQKATLNLSNTLLEVERGAPGTIRDVKIHVPPCAAGIYLYHNPENCNNCIRHPGKCWTANYLLNNGNSGLTCVDIPENSIIESEIDTGRENDSFPISLNSDASFGSGNYWIKIEKMPSGKLEIKKVTT
ncbi:MAG: hypothetical protein J7K00_01970 [Candidatus Diapherotrites archaeon]|nr:hypothetical protein [Candidatus Diapherotrites archaeon]